MPKGSFPLDTACNLQEEDGISGAFASYVRADRTKSFFFSIKFTTTFLFAAESAAQRNLWLRGLEAAIKGSASSNLDKSRQLTQAVKKNVLSIKEGFLMKDGKGGLMSTTRMRLDTRTVHHLPFNNLDQLRLFD